MDLKSYWATLSKSDREQFARRVQSTVGHLRNVMYGVRPCATDLAVDIERATAATVTRCELRPHDYWRHWPDLPMPPQRWRATAGAR